MAIHPDLHPRTQEYLNQSTASMLSLNIITKIYEGSACSKTIAYLCMTLADYNPTRINLSIITPSHYSAYQIRYGVYTIKRHISTDNNQNNASHSTAYPAR